MTYSRVSQATSTPKLTRALTRALLDRKNKNSFYFPWFSRAGRAGGHGRGIPRAHHLGEKDGTEVKITWQDYSTKALCQGGKGTCACPMRLLGEPRWKGCRDFYATDSYMLNHVNGKDHPKIPASSWRCLT